MHWNTHSTKAHYHEGLFKSSCDSGNLQPFELGAGNELEPKTSPPMTRTTRHTTRLAIYVTALPEVYELPSDDVLGRRGVLLGLQQSTLLLYYPRGPAARVLPRLRSSAVYERVRQPLRLQANQEPSGTSQRTTRLRLQYLARHPIGWIIEPPTRRSRTQLMTT
jgi:hypothetical protein